MAYEGAPIAWVANHRRHHVVADTIDDPHSPQHHGGGLLGRAKGLWHAHVGWLFTYRGTGSERHASDLLADRDIVVMNALFPVWCVVSLVVPFGLGWLIGGSFGAALGGLFWAGLVRVAVLHHATWSVNSLCHMFGRRPLDECRHTAGGHLGTSCCEAEHHGAAHRVPDHGGTTHVERFEHERQVVHEAVEVEPPWRWGRTPEPAVVHRHHPPAPCGQPRREGREDGQVRAVTVHQDERRADTALLDVDASAVGHLDAVHALGGKRQATVRVGIRRQIEPGEDAALVGGRRRHPDGDTTGDQTRQDVRSTRPADGSSGWRAGV